LSITLRWRPLEGHAQTAIKKAGKKLDAEMKAIVWPDLFQRPKVKITARERAAAKIKK
jgi:hypothetical protein